MSDEHAEAKVESVTLPADESLENTVEYRGNTAEESVGKIGHAHAWIELSQRP